MAFSPPRQIAGYHVLRQLGQGGMSRVFLGYDVTTYTPVAIKILAEHLADSGTCLQRFHRESRLCRILNHPNLIRGFESGYDREARRHYLVLEYIDGTPVHTLLRTQGRFPVGFAVHLAIQLTDALHYLHEHNYVHRDIKPENIMITLNGQAKLGDFGLAKRISETSDLTMPHQGVGTPQYMPYEQWQNSALVDGRSDLFALGATLFHLLTGEVPFSGTTPSEILREKTCSLPPRIRDRDRNLPAEVDVIVARAISPCIRQRYQSAREFRDDLVKTGLADSDNYPGRAAAADWPPGGDQCPTAFAGFSA